MVRKLEKKNLSLKNRKRDLPLDIKISLDDKN